MEDYGGIGKLIRNWATVATVVAGLIWSTGNASANLQATNASLAEMKERISRVETAPPQIPPAILERLAKQEQALEDIKATVHQIEDDITVKNNL